jgi:hypothetical protein
MRILFIILVSSIALLAQSLSCESLCTQCQDQNSELCSNIEETCSCSFETTESPVQNNYAQNTTSPVIKVNFGAEERHDQTNLPITQVDFGPKGDSYETAVLQDDGSYELRSKNHLLIMLSVIGGIILTGITVGIIISN